MSTHIPAATFAFAMARSEFIDGHISAELAVREKLATLKVPPNHLFGQNIEALSKVSAAPQYSKKERERVNGLLDELRGLHSIRCDVVHSKMHLLSIEDVDHALFAHVQKKSRHGWPATLLTLAELSECTSDLLRIARELQSSSGATQQPSVPK